MLPRSFIGIDLHSDSFICCILKKNEDPLYQKYSTDSDGIRAFKKSISKTDQLAVEATTNSAYFCKQVEKYVKRIVLVAPNQFAIIGKSTNKSDSIDAYKLAFFLSKNMLP